VGVGWGVGCGSKEGGGLSASLPFSSPVPLAFSLRPCFSAFYIARAPPFPPLVPVDNYAGFSCFSKGRLLVFLSLKFEFWN
jgi:hypothetical protein